MNFIFDWLVTYHIERNLFRCLPYLQEGRVVHHNGLPYMEGDENTHYSGLLIVAHPLATAPSQLADAEDVEQFEPVLDKAAFFSYLERVGKKDGAHFFDPQSKRVARVFELNNVPLKGLPWGQVLSTKLPKNFVYNDGRGVARADLGTKTRLAIKLPMKYPGLEIFQVKQSAYGRFGVGKVTHFTQEGLTKEFFFDFNGQNIEGVYRTYHHEAGSVQSAERRSTIDISQLPHVLQQELL